MEYLKCNSNIFTLQFLKEIFQVEQKLNYVLVFVSNIAVGNTETKWNHNMADDI
jgi:negative regulator of sigma E activity